MINVNGEIIDSQPVLSAQNRGFLYGDAVFETLKIVNNHILFFEDHYFRLMASMRIVRMEIPMYFTLEYLEEQILHLAKANQNTTSGRVKLVVYRNEGGFYLPESNKVSFLIEVFPLQNKEYRYNSSHYEVDLYKDFMITKQLLSTLKTTNRLVNVTASIYAKENQLDNCLLLNNEKNIVEALNGNLFLLAGNVLKTPPLSEGCLNGIMRKQIFSLVKKIDHIEVLETIISPFDLQKADELFITNIITGVQPITKYRKKEYDTHLSKQIVSLLNELMAN